ncbi:MAG: hypothetical protein Aureis2KO_20900 [Aureisphaera sp.]
MQTLLKLQHLIDQAENQGKSLNLHDTIAAIETLERISEHPDFLRKITRLLLQTEIMSSQIDTLSTRENEVFQWIGLGCSSREIGKLMDITESTVSTHRKKIIKKLKLSGQGELLKFAIESKYLFHNTR